MQSHHQKWVNFSYLFLAVLVGYISFASSSKIASVYDLEASFRNIDLVIRVGSLVVSGLVFLILSRNERANQFMSEVVVELSRVTWPTQKETTSATFVVIVMVLISGMVLGFLDYFWTKVMQLVL